MLISIIVLCICQEGCRLLTESIMAHNLQQATVYISYSVFKMHSHYPRKMWINFLTRNRRYGSSVFQVVLNSHAVNMICDPKLHGKRSRVKTQGNPYLIIWTFLIISNVKTHWVHWEEDKSNIHDADNGVHPRGSKLHIVWSWSIFGM